MPRLVCISDTHMKHLNMPRLPEGDILIHAGDMTGRGSVWEHRDVLKWFKGLKSRYKAIIVIAGNHDFGLEPERQVGGIDLIKEYKDEVIYLQDESVEVLGYRFYGTPWTPVFMNWAFMDSEEGLQQRLQSIPSETEVLISHGPPKHILDRTDRGDHVGSKALYTACQRLENLKAVIYGHIHESYGHYLFQGVDYYNVAVLSSRYKLQNPPTIIELPSKY